MEILAVVIMISVVIYMDKQRKKKELHDKLEELHRNGGLSNYDDYN